MRHIFKILALLSAFIIDSAWGSFLEIWGIAPSFLLVAVIALAMASEEAEAGMYGLGAGVLWDLVWGRTFGFYALLYMFIALLSRAFLELIYKNSTMITAGVTFIASFVCEMVLCLVGSIIWGEGNFVFQLFRIMIPTAAYTAVIQILLFRPITAISRPKEERRSRL